MHPRRRWLAAAGAVVSLSGCELFWSWDGIGSGIGSSPKGADAGGCGSTTAILCDDFEHDDGSNNPWQPLTTLGGTASIDTTRATSGTHSLHAQVVSPGGADSIGAQWTRSVNLPPTAYLRMKVFAAHPLAGWQDFGSFGDTSGNFIALWVGTGTPTDALGWADNADSTNPSVSYATTWTGANAWSCVELEVDRTANRVRVWINGQESTDLEQSGVIFPQMSVLDIGAYVVPSTGAPAATYDLWIDDVVVDTQYADCVL
jgi:hypothetical protein